MTKSESDALIGALNGGSNSTSNSTKDAVLKEAAVNETISEIQQLVVDGVIKAD